MHINIIIPTYKPQTYLWECLDSVFSQATGGYTYEVLLVLNGPKEPYYTEIRQYISSHPTRSVRFLYSKKAGVSAARNLALECAQADYITFIDDDEAMSIANDTLYGLGAGVWTRSVHKAYRFGRGIQAGRVWTNCYHLYPAHAAFGGYKQSGIGRENHLMMLNHYQQTKNMLVSYDPKAMGFF